MNAARATAGCGAGLLGVSLLACSGQTGLPAAPSAAATSSLDATTGAVTSMPSPPIVALAGRVTSDGSDAGVAGALVVVEVGGLGSASPSAHGPDGGLVATVAFDPYVRFGGLADDAGAFTFAVPAGPTGLHVLAPPYLEGRQLVMTATSPDARGPLATVALRPLPAADAGARDAGDAGEPTVPRPTVTGLTPTPSVVSPLAPLVFAVNVAASGPGDPLSGDVFLVEPGAGSAAALAPPTAAVPGGAYPDGVYNREVEAPGSPGVYTYTVVASSLHGVTSLPVSVVVTVTPTGFPAPPDAGFFQDGGGLPDGRH